MCCFVTDRRSNWWCAGGGRSGLLLACCYAGQGESSGRGGISCCSRVRRSFARAAQRHARTKRSSRNSVKHRGNAQHGIDMPFLVATLAYVGHQPIRAKEREPTMISLVEPGATQSQAATTDRRSSKHHHSCASPYVCYHVRVNVGVYFSRTQQVQPRSTLPAGRPGGCAVHSSL